MNDPYLKPVTLSMLYNKGWSIVDICRAVV